MPFTPSHAVVALPFIRTPLVPAAIAIGAMTPDLPLFVRGMGLGYAHTHDLAWLPATALLALGLLLVWRCILRPGMRELAPAWLASRLPTEWDADVVAGLRETFAVTGTPPRASWPRIVLLILSLILGVATHIVWDAFTHEDRWGTRTLPFLVEPWGPFAGYKWLQHGSSIVGLLIIGVWVSWWLRRRAAGNLDRALPGWVRTTWWISLPAALAIGWAWGLVAWGPLDAGFTVAHLAYRALPPACAVWGGLTVLLCLLVQARRRDTPGFQRRFGKSRGSA